MIGSSPTPVSRSTSAPALSPGSQASGHQTGNQATPRLWHPRVLDAVGAARGSRSAWEDRRAQARDTSDIGPSDGLVGSSRAVQDLRADIQRLTARLRRSSRPPAILIRGETGTGKGLVAGILHRVGPRAAGPFVDVNCAAIPETLLEAELFGYERGAFTDARHSKPGLFQVAHGGTLFLDEIGLLPAAPQAKLLKVLDDRSVRRLGATLSELTDVWIISATNADLLGAVRERRFREDLYHRLAVVTINLPPLCQRDDDAVELAEHFLARACADYRLPAKSLALDARALIRAYRWPGNIRELANAMERVAVLTEASHVTAAMLGLKDQRAGLSLGPRADPPGPGQRDQVRAALEQTGWNISRTAAILGVTRNTVRARIQSLGLRRDGHLRSDPEGSFGQPRVPASDTPADRAADGGAKDRLAARRALDALIELTHPQHTGGSRSDATTSSVRATVPGLDASPPPGHTTRSPA